MQCSWIFFFASSMHRSLSSTECKEPTWIAGEGKGQETDHMVQTFIFKGL